jgi:parallel beta-helix repeat protein
VERGLTINMRSIAGLTLLAVLCVSAVLAPCLNLTSAQLQSANYIMPDGSVTGTSNIDRVGDLYTFSGNVAGALTVEKDNIVINGAGFTLQNQLARGVVLAQRDNVTLENLRVELGGGYIIDLTNTTDSYLINDTLVGTGNSPTSPTSTASDQLVLEPYAINCLYTDNVTIEGNTITDASTGLSIDLSNGNTIIRNNISDGLVGVDMENSQNNYFRDNAITDQKWGFMLETDPSYGYDNNIDSSNTVDGKPIIYWVNVHQATVSSESAFIALVHCQEITVQDTDPQGIVLAFSSNCKITNVQMTGTAGEGIALVNSSNVDIMQSTLDNQAIGVNFLCSSHNLVSQCTIRGSISRGIDFDASNNNVVSKNSITSCEYAVAPFQSTISNNTVISDNTFSGDGLAIITPGALTVSNNTFTENDNAIFCMNGLNTVSGNYFEGNNQSVIIQSTNNLLHNNIFTNNVGVIEVNGVNYNNNIDQTNTVNGKPIIYWVNKHDETVPAGAGLIALVNCTGIKVVGQTLTYQANGLLLAFTTKSTIAHNMLSNDGNGIYLLGSTYNEIAANNITNDAHAIYIDAEASAILGVPPIYVPSDNNVFFCNNFVGNTQNLFDAAGSYLLPTTAPSVNIWDNGSLGNYWSSYSGTELDNSGVGATPYNVSTNNTDNYPLIAPFNIAAPVNLLSNEASSTSPIQPSELELASVIAAILVVVLVVSLVYRARSRRSAESL